MYVHVRTFIKHVCPCRRRNRLPWQLLRKSGKNHSIYLRGIWYPWINNINIILYIYSSSYHIDIDNGSLTLYGVKAITHVTNGNDLSTVTSLNIDYIDCNEVCTKLLLPLKDKMVNLKVCGY